MSGKKYDFTVFIVSLVMFFSVGAFGQQIGNGGSNISCVNCHKTLGGELAKPVAEWTGSIHQQNGITCPMCHGGNPSGTTMDTAMSKAAGFIGAPHGQAQFDACGKCHPTEAARFANSIMGKAYLEGKGGPSCAKCHGPHHNEIPVGTKICESCHKDTTGFDTVDPMNVTKSTVDKLSKLVIKTKEDKIKGQRPSVVPHVSEDLDPYKIGLIAFGAASFVFILGYILYLILEKRD